MASWRGAGWEEAQPDLGVTSNTQIGRAFTRSSIAHEPSRLIGARARIVIEKCTYRNLTLLLTRYDTKGQLGLLWDESRLLETSHSGWFSAEVLSGPNSDAGGAP
jgi:hypothetical protein